MTTPPRIGSDAEPALKPFDDPSHYQDIDFDEVYSPYRDLSPPRRTLLLAAEVERRTRLDIRTIDRLVQIDKFPPPIRLSKRRRAWDEADVNRWLAGPGDWNCF